MRCRNDVARTEMSCSRAKLSSPVSWTGSTPQQARGLGLAVASSSEHEWVDTHLTRLGLRERFAYLACHDGRLRAKPAPDTYLDACEAVGVAPGDAIAVEDSFNGVVAARAAGMRVVAVPNGVTSAMDFSTADLVLSSLAECALDDAIARLTPRSG